MASGGNRIPSLDGFRAISIGLVLIGHLAGSRHFLQSSSLAHAGDLGNLGVRTFFVISGFLITRLLLNERLLTGHISLAAFYRRRVLRIFPAFYAFIAVIAILGGLHMVDLDRADLMHALTYTMNYYPTEHFAVRHLWSLSVEEQFYLVWPAALLLLGTRRSSWALVGVLALVPIARVALFSLGEQDELIRTSFETVCDALATGCLLAVLLPWAQQRPSFQAFLRHPLVAALPLAIVAANLQTDHPKIFWLFCIPFMNIAIAVLIARYVTWADLPLGRLLNWPPLAAIGVMSYSLYLWQELFLIQFRDPRSFAQEFPFNLLLAIAAATVSYRFIERPFLRLKRHAQRSTAPGLTVELATDRPALPSQ